MDIDTNLERIICDEKGHCFSAFLFTGIAGVAISGAVMGYAQGVGKAPIYNHPSAAGFYLGFPLVLSAIGGSLIPTGSAKSGALKAVGVCAGIEAVTFGLGYVLGRLTN